MWLLCWSTQTILLTSTSQVPRISATVPQTRTVWLLGHQVRRRGGELGLLVRALIVMQAGVAANAASMRCVIFTLQLPSESPETSE